MGFFVADFCIPYSIPFFISTFVSIPHWLSTITRDKPICCLWYGYMALLFGYLRSFAFHINFMTVLSSSVKKNAIEIMNEIALHMQIAFSNTAIFVQLCQSTGMWGHPSSVLFIFFLCCVKALIIWVFNLLTYLYA